MKKFKICILLLLVLSICIEVNAYVSGTYKSTYFERKLRKLETESVHYGQSVYYRLNEDVPLGSGSSMYAVRTMTDLRVKNVVLEARGTVDPKVPEKVNFGPYGGGVEYGFSSLIAGIHASGMTVVLKLKLVNPDGLSSIMSSAPTTDKFWESYLRFATRYAKIAQKSAVAELVIATGITHSLCVSDYFQKLLDTVRYYYTGRIRIDVTNVSELKNLTQCIGTRLNDIDTIGLEAENDPDPSEVFFNLTNAEKVLRHTGTHLVLAKIAFTGSNQAQKLQDFLSFYNKQFTNLSAKHNLTIGVFDVDPDKATINDLSDGVIGKPTLKVIESWFAN